ncbi:hypothetical protein VaNZ11_008050 [Volvox africanus]|uniref:RING-type domain-containing protein n=1 Tax=Volvox africanus TaxID=51714 RepID=A0ABQ5S464_9CHLO|nr:hypothetical protein VaNZ11_008050 [Volvox africanus]
MSCNPTGGSLSPMPRLTQMSTRLGPPNRVTCVPTHVCHHLSVPATTLTNTTINSVTMAIFCYQIPCSFVHLFVRIELQLLIIVLMTHRSAFILYVSAQDRPAGPLASSLSCALCHELLQEAMTSLECGHSYCYDCIERRVDIGGNHNICPVEGCGVVLGPSPFDHHRLVYDTLLDGLMQKIFPRPDLDAALTTRRAEREEATRQARAAVNGCGGGQRNNQHNHHRQAHQQQHCSQQHQPTSARASREDGAMVAGGRRRRGGNSMDGGADGDDEGTARARPCTAFGEGIAWNRTNSVS